MSTTHSIAHLDAGHTYDATTRLRQSLADCDRVLSPGTHAPRYCHDCGTLIQMCLAAATEEDEGRYVVPAPCADCGGYTLVPEPHRAGRVIDVAALVTLLTLGRPTAWALGQRAYQPRSAYRYVAIIGADGVRVWRTNADGWMDRYLGRIDGRTTRADVWKMRQQMAWMIAAEIGLVRR